MKKVFVFLFLLFLTSVSFSQNALLLSSAQMEKLKQEGLLLCDLRESCKLVATDEMSSALSRHLSPIRFPTFLISSNINRLFNENQNWTLSALFFIVTHRWDVGPNSNARLIQRNEDQIRFNYVLFEAYNLEIQAELFIRELKKLIILGPSSTPK